jgi:hypothetical protein
MEPTLLQESFSPPISKAQYLALCAEAEALMIENKELKERVAHLELQIATHAYGGWQLH